MNLTLGRRGDYAVRASICLAQAWERGEPVKIREVSESMQLPSSYTPQIMGLLVRADIARAKAGPDGGYRLARPPQKISVLEVVESAEGDLRPATCILRGGSCRWDSACAMHDVWTGASEAFMASLANTSLAEVAKVSAAGSRA